MAPVAPNWKRPNVYQQENGYKESMVESHHMITQMNV